MITFVDLPWTNFSFCMSSDNVLVKACPSLEASIAALNCAAKATLLLHLMFHLHESTICLDHGVVGPEMTISGTQV